MSHRIIYRTENVQAQRSVRVYRHPETDEFVCRLTQNGRLRSQADYFTNDKDDAIATADAMVLPPASQPRRSI